jgi:acetoin utilization protein AcuB
MDPNQSKSHPRLSVVRVRDAMTPDPVTLPPTAHLADAVELMEARGVQHLPIVTGGALVGLLSERHVRDALPSVLTLRDPVARRRFLAATRIDQVWIPDPLTISPNESILAAIATMRAKKAGSLPVVEGGKLVGILTSGDLITLLERMLKQ